MRPSARITLRSKKMTKMRDGGGSNSLSIRRRVDKTCRMCQIAKLGGGGDFFFLPKIKKTYRRVDPPLNSIVSVSLCALLSFFAVLLQQNTKKRKQPFGAMFRKCKSHHRKQATSH
ncbi:uncharacterized protein C5L36_0A11855 [Pichia kudriavzevii]|uniref:Uncharacterized protein n=1 Tax=Pichia kudriavzevii TaxID=4909 RepID=A0A2U9R0B0_PICKU|nr:uncharacterized protein C5L36_0A11855 [Pichia kudriavzevii]AWU74606.1 hypothetical protein C5L36_0A11855 [Pichia kudriavzevii]